MTSIKAKTRLPDVSFSDNVTAYYTGSFAMNLSMTFPDGTNRTILFLSDDNCRYVVDVIDENNTFVAEIAADGCIDAGNMLRKRKIIDVAIQIKDGVITTVAAGTLNQLDALAALSPLVAANKNIIAMKLFQTAF